MTLNRLLGLLVSLVCKHGLIVLLGSIADFSGVVSLSFSILEKLLFQGDKILLDFLPVRHPLRGHIKPIGEPTNKESKNRIRMPSSV